MGKKLNKKEMRIEEILKQEEALKNSKFEEMELDIARWNKAAEIINPKKYYDPLEGNHIGINSEFFD